MTSDNDLRDLFAQQAARALSADAVRSRFDAALRRRRHRRQGLAVVCAGVAVTGVVLAAQALEPGRPTGTNQLLATPPPAVVASPTTPIPVSPAGSTTENDRDLFFADGYTYLDAGTLGTIWDADVFTAKTVAGQVLADGGTLPIRPGQAAGSARVAHVAQALGAYANAGYGYDDAEQLAALWGETDPSLVKAVAGQQLLDGRALPVTSSGQARPSTS